MNNVMTWISDPLLLACAAYIVGAVAPGPNTALIATTTMRSGYRVGFASVFGVVCSSLIWGLLIASVFTISSSAMSSVTSLLQVMGGAYLLFLSVLSLRSALANRTANVENANIKQKACRAFGLGFLVNLSNPNAVLTWIATIAIATTSTASSKSAILAVIICWSFGVVIYSAHALFFANPVATAFYNSRHKSIYIFVSVVFGATGISLLSSQM